MFSLCKKLSENIGTKLFYLRNIAFLFFPLVSTYTSDFTVSDDMINERPKPGTCFLYTQRALSTRKAGIERFRFFFF